MRRLSAVICIVLLLGAAVGIVALEVWHGPVVLSLSVGHGIDSGDLLAAPLLALAIALGRGQSTRRPSGSWAVPASAIALGALLVAAGVVAKAGGGPLVPLGGATFDGAIQQTGGTSPLPVDRWSYVATTYNSDTLTMYVNGRQVASRGVSGTIQTPRTPLWIGGNRPYGEHFDGLIDEVRIYDRALSPEELRDDMAAPVARAPGLVAAYAFDRGSGHLAADASGKGNAGEIREATWVRGRYGAALRFDGEGSVVRVPPSTSLNLTNAMTLSGWIRPSAPQAGWRTVVQRQTDAYMLTASSDQQGESGLTDDLRTALLVAAAAWFSVVIATGRSPSGGARRRTWWLPVALFALGSVADAAFDPTATLVGPALVALWLAVTASTRLEMTSFLLAAALCFGLSVAEIATVDATQPRGDGSTARTAALGALFLLGGLYSTVTVFARLRGWSTLRPRSRAIR